MQIERLEAISAGQIFSRHEAVAAGISGRTLTKFARAGLVARVGHGVYRAGTTPARHDPRSVSRSMHVAISHDSAAAWCGGSLPFAPSRLHVTGPRNRKPRPGRSDAIQLHRSDVPARELMIIRGVLVTTPVRTVLDIARTKPLTESVAIADSLCRLGLCSPAQVANAAVALAPGPGRPAALQVAGLIDPQAESVFESMSRVNMALAGLLSPVPQLNIFGRDGSWIARVDFAWPDCRLVLECDGFEHHSSREAFNRDRRRWSALTRAGWRVIVVTWRDVVGDPTYFIDLVAELTLHTSTHNSSPRRAS